MEMSLSISGSMRSKDGVIDVRVASSLPAAFCSSKLSFKSRSSKITGLVWLSAESTDMNVDCSQDRDEVGECRDRVDIRQLDDQPVHGCMWSAELRGLVGYGLLVDTAVSCTDKAALGP